MNKIISLFLCICCTLVLVQFTSCSEEKHKFVETIGVQDEYITQLDTLIASMNRLANNSDYGTREGQYPAESRAILTDAISNANRYVLLIRYQTPSPSESEKQRYISEINNTIEKFKNSKRTEDAETIPAELFVDGKTTQSYIDFGRSKDYTVFGTTGNQSFTIEFWVKIKERGPYDNSIFMSTFFSNSDNQWRNGWMMYWRNVNNGIYRVTWGGILSGNRWGLWEPSYPAPQEDVWQHFAFVYSDKGLDGNSALRAKLYLNGTVAATQNNSNASEVYNSSDYDNYDKPMTAFCRWVNNDKMEEGFSGYMKKIRIWKEAKDDAYIQASFKEETEIIGRENNLVAAWDFTSKPSGADNTVLDLTGKHEAKIIGTYKWEQTQ
ncbi:hypothetical protein A8C56_03525 [Niabella ginsenosidivorans]|uniref:DUF4972 domain-containing protein n=1 Tax=Niabella ginsenosidivorans TaxID=1176587 RepID=A0A1A9HYK3_9BACT|nr:DUF4972 domain-containing protein [Niabella ginsenosidivorans]ANH80175.1 hypothetical protein A8C56_03525 [Niabella ginsenosidivorans]